jgi:hypothetical protein
MNRTLISLPIALLLSTAAGAQDLATAVAGLTSQLGRVGEYHADVFIKYT